MLPLEQQVCSLEYAKRFEELGVKQESLFYWISNKNNPLVYSNPYIKTCDVVENFHVGYLSSLIVDTVEHFSAFTVAELDHLLIPEVYTRKMHDTNLYRTRYMPLNTDVRCIDITNLNPADSRSLMLIYLLENDIVKVEDINKC